MAAKKIKPTLIILDDVPERCLREEEALDKALADKNIHALGAANFGKGFINRSGVDMEKLPCIQVEDLYYFPPRIGEELTYEGLCQFLDMLLQKGIVETREE